jgi:hypothetical protein
VKLSARAVARHLLADEVFIEQVVTQDNETIPTRVAVGKGFKPWREAAAKVFLFANQRARYGVRLSYMNGSLPPSFKATNGFQIGFVIESADDKSSGSAASAPIQ